MNDGIRKLANGHWNTRYVGPDGRRYSRTFRVKQDATYWRSHELRLIDIDQWSPPASRNPKPATTRALTVAEWTEQCIKARENRSRRPIRPTTADVYRKIARLTVTSSL
ncbi:MAG: hypothetical protein ABIS84_04940, partial [Arachnia sp.]